MKVKKDYSFGVIPFQVKNDKKFFLLIHHQKGHWSFPKGHPEEGENKFQTAIRELAEEAGISKVRLFQNNAFLEKYNFEENGVLIDKTVEYFLGEIEEDSVTIQDEEIQNYAWCNANEAMQYITFSATRKAFKDALEWFEHNYQ